MKLLTIVTVILSFSLVGCSTSKMQSKKRLIASEAVSSTDLSGTQLGVARFMKDKFYAAKYDEKRHKKTKRFKAVRVYFNKIEGTSDSYHAIVLEYTNLLRMAPTYIGSNKLPLVQSIFGFLKKIIYKTHVYKVTPSSERGQYDMQILNARDGRLEAAQSENPLRLILSEKENLQHPLSGARILHYAKSKKGNDVDLFFPEIPKEETKEEAKKRKKAAKFGMQYNLANFVYSKMKLDSTWRMNFLSGPYLRAYNDKKHKVLDLIKSDGKNEAEFIIEKYKRNGKLATKRRAKRFTNVKSAAIEGNFVVTKPANGIFIFSSTKADNKGAQHVEDRIGLFIDIFDASVSLNQDVVELILVDSNNPEDFLMYYEHPDNGEGTKENKEK